MPLPGAARLIAARKKAASSFRRAGVQGVSAADLKFIESVAESEAGASHTEENGDRLLLGCLSASLLDLVYMCVATRSLLTAFYFWVVRLLQIIHSMYRSVKMHGYLRPTLAHHRVAAFADVSRQSYLRVSLHCSDLMPPFYSPSLL